MKKFQNLGLFLILFVLSSIISYWVYMEIFFFYSASIFQELYRYFYGEYWVPLIMIFIITFFLSSFLYQLILKKFDKKWIKNFYIFYGILLVYFLFIKSIGIRGIELNPLELFNDIFYGDSMIVFLNILIFIPLGWILPRNKKIMTLVLISMLSIEVTQYIFKLGFFDINDITTNFIGCLLGTYLSENIFFKKYITQKIK